MSLFARVRKALSASQVGVEPHSWALPSPSSFSPSKPGSSKTLIPDPKVFANAHVPGHIEYNTDKNPLVYPDVSHAAVHLALLECFHNLRLSATDVDLDVPPAYNSSRRNSADEDEDDATHRWHTLVRLAVTRFESWWASIDAILNHAAIYASRPSERIGVQLTKDYLPPLDVLFVWYAFMLDTDAYRLECTDPRHSDQVRQLCFPWTAIRDVVDTDAMTYTLPRAAEVLFDTMSGQSAEMPLYLQEPPAYADHAMAPLHVDLFDIAKRHDAFIDDAHRLLWIRAPSLRGSLERASVAYFASQLLQGGEAMDRLGPDSDRVLSFGVELVWRTHRLYSDQYACFQRVMQSYPKHYDVAVVDDAPRHDSPDALRVLDSNDSTPSTTSTSTSTSTSATSTSTSAASGLCICWTCERIRDDVPDFVHPRARSNSSSSHSSSSSSSSRSRSSPDVPSQLASLSSSQLRQMLNDLGFHRAVEEARGQGRPLPVRPAGESDSGDGMPGSMAGLLAYFEKMPDGSYKVRKETQAVPWSKVV